MGDEEKLEVVDIPDRELFAAGTFRGTDYTVEDLDAMVAATNELPHLRHPVKIDHDEEQKLVVNSGLPSIGWVENVRRVGDKVVGDFKNVPKKLASLIEAGAYRQTSAELYRNFTDQVTKKTYPLVYRAQAILGASIPEVKNLDDIIALYTEMPEGEVEVVTFTVPQGTFTSDGSFEDLKRRIEEKLPERTYVRSTFPTYVVATRWGDEMDRSDHHYAIAYTQNEGEIELGESVELDVKEQTVYSAAKFSEERVEAELRFWDSQREDTGKQDAGESATHQEGVEFMERTELIAALGLADDADDAAVMAKVTELRTAAEKPPAIQVDGQVFTEADIKYFADTRSPEYKALVEDAKAGRQVQLERFAEKRDALIGDAVEAGKLSPDDMALWQGLYDKDPDATSKALAGLKGTRIDLSERGSARPDKGVDLDDDEGNEKLAAAVEKYMEANPDVDFVTAYEKVSAGKAKEVK